MKSYTGNWTRAVLGICAAMISCGISGCSTTQVAVPERNQFASPPTSVTTPPKTRDYLEPWNAIWSDFEAQQKRLQQELLDYLRTPKPK